MYTYNSNNYLIVFVGIPIIGGKGPDSFITIAPTTPRFSTEAGVDGVIIRSESNDARAIITLTLQETSPLNAALSTVHAVDKLSGDGILPSSVKNLYGLDIHIMSKSWIVDTPEVSQGVKAGTRVWVAETDSLIPFVGGQQSV